MARRRRMALRMRASSSYLLDGLGQEVVGAGVERRDHVLRRRMRRDDDHRQGGRQRVGAQPAADLEAVDARQGQVEQHHLRRVLDDRAHARLAVADAEGVIALALQDACQQRALGRLVLDDQHQCALSARRAIG